MARRLNETRQRAAAHQASRRMIAHGDRPAYRVTASEDGRWRVDAMPWVSVTATTRREALDEARGAIAAWLHVEPDSFDVESYRWLMRWDGFFLNRSARRRDPGIRPCTRRR